MKRFPTWLFPSCIGLTVFLMGLSITVWLGNVEKDRYRRDVEANVLQQLSTVRAGVESALNKRIYLTLGLRAYVSTNPNLNEEQFARIAAVLMEEGDGIRSVTLIKDNLISDVYPRENNLAALGVDLLEIPEQRADVLRAIETRQPWLSAPILLVQGGEAFVNRAPVYETPVGGLPGSGRYWGLVSILINKDSLLNDIVDRLPDQLQLAIRAKAPEDKGWNYFLGDTSIEAAQPLLLDVNLPTGDWQVSGVPIDGWPEQAPASRVLLWVGTVASACVAALSYLLLQSNNSCRLFQQTAEDVAVQLARKNEDLEAFVRTASHDLRSPLRHIRVFSEVLAQDATDRLNDVDRDYLSKIQSSINRMMLLLDSLLRFAKAGAEGINPTVFSLQEVAEWVVEQLPEHDQTKVQIAPLPDVYGDKILMSQVMQNLIENALKYYRGDDCQVRIQAQSEAGRTTITVSDNGIGMQVGQLERIFKPGVRGVAEAEIAGSGFGLAICERIVRAQGGRIWAESKPKVGSTFFVSLPSASN